MKVLLTTDTVGGVWTYALELSRSLRNLDVEVVLAAAGPPLTSDREEEARTAGVRLFAREAALEWMEDPWADLAETREWLLELAAFADVDLVHLNEYAHAQAPWNVPVVLVGHSCVLSWHEEVRGVPAPAEWNRYRELVAGAVADADLLVAPTYWMLDQLERLYGRARARLVIPNGRDASGFTPLEKEPFVLTAGRIWDEGKNVAAVDRAASALDWPVFATGDAGTWRPRSLRLLGQLPAAELARWFGRASIFALPARYEPFGLSPLEAALSGCALVLGDIPSLREVWGEAATYVDPGDDAAIAAAVERLIADDRLRHELATAAHRRARAYKASRMAASYVEAYQRLLREVQVVAAAS